MATRVVNRQRQPKGCVSPWDGKIRKGLPSVEVQFRVWKGRPSPRVMNWQDILGWTPEELAKRLGVTVNTIRHMEKAQGSKLARWCIRCGDIRQASEMRLKGNGTMAKICKFCDPTKKKGEDSGARDDDRWLPRNVIDFSRKPWPHQAGPVVNRWLVQHGTNDTAG